MPTDTIATHLYRSPLLGTPRMVRVKAGDIRVFERGSGPAVVFAHGWLGNANLWRKVVDQLAGSHRCVVLDLPLGAHGTPVDPDADLTPPGVGAIITEAIAALDLEGCHPGRQRFRRRLFANRHRRAILRASRASCWRPAKRPTTAFRRRPSPACRRRRNPSIS